MDYKGKNVDEQRMLEFEKILLTSPSIDTGETFFQKRTIPENVGVYIWCTKDDQEIVYVGSAIGEKSRHTGLYRRIITELLNPKYLLVINDKVRKSDAYQVRHCAYTDRAKKPAIDKNAFRKNIGRIEKIPPGEPTVNFIKTNFILRYIVTDSKNIAKQLEKKIITEKKPKYNILGK